MEIFQKNPQIMYLEQELESLKAVLEIKNEKLHQQDIKLMKMEKLVGFLWGLAVLDCFSELCSGDEFRLVRLACKDFSLFERKHARIMGHAPTAGTNLSVLDCSKGEQMLSVVFRSLKTATALHKL